MVCLAMHVLPTEENWIVLVRKHFYCIALRVEHDVAVDGRKLGGVLLCRVHLVAASLLCLGQLCASKTNVNADDESEEQQATPREIGIVLAQLFQT